MSLLSIIRALPGWLFPKLRSGFLFTSDMALSFLSRAGMENGNTCLIVRTDNIGDFVLWLDAAAQMRNHYRSCRMVAVVGAASADLAQRCGVFDEIIPVDIPMFTRSVTYRWKLMRKLQGYRAATVIQPTYSRMFLIGDAIVRLCGAPERIGFAGDLSNMSQWQRKLSDSWYTRLVPSSPGPLMEIERNRDFLRGLGVVTAEARVTQLPVMAQLPEALRVEGDYFIIFPGASWLGRMWPVDSFAQIANVVHEQYGWRMVVCGSRSETGLGDQLLHKAGLSGAMNLCGSTTLGEFVEVVRRARLLIGNETSAPHLAAAVDTPSVCILGGGHFGRFVPYSRSVVGARPVCAYTEMPCFGCNWRCIHEYGGKSCVPCIAQVSVEQVVNSVNQALSPSQSCE